MLVRQQQQRLYKNCYNNNDMTSQGISDYQEREPTLLFHKLDRFRLATPRDIYHIGRRVAEDATAANSNDEDNHYNDNDLDTSELPAKIQS
jgi:hypothetical protein